MYAIEVHYKNFSQAHYCRNEMLMTNGETHSNGLQKERRCTERRENRQISRYKTSTCHQSV